MSDKYYYHLKGNIEGHIFKINKLIYFIYLNFKGAERNVDFFNGAER